MVNDDLRKAADELEARLEAGRPGRRAARERTVGRLITSGRLPFPEESLRYVRGTFEKEVDVEQLFDLAVLEQHGYKFKDGLVIGPPSWPRGAPPRLGSALEVSSPATGAAAGSGSSGGSGGTISRAEARHQVLVSREYAAWSDAIRELEVWKAAQARRAWMLGRFFAGSIIKAADLRELVRQKVAENGNQEEIELWSEADLRADYTPQELGEGA